MKTGLKIGLLAACVLALSACSSMFSGHSDSGGSMSPQAAAPSLDLTQKSTRRNVNVNFLADANINANADGKAAPVLVKIYQLRSEEPFESADFNDLAKRDVLILGGSLLRQSEFMIKPGAAAHYKFGYSSRARYLGVVAVFAAGGHGGQWKVLKDISGGALSSGGGIQVHLSGNRLTVSK